MKAPTEIYNIPRPSFLWLLAAVVGVILPHVLRLPFWLTAICALCVGLRVLIYQGRLSFPGKRIKVALVLLMLILVGAQFGSQLYSTDATVALLLTGIALKLLEMQHKRDVLLVIYLCYFTIIAEFIYTQTIPITLYMLMVVLLTTTALLSLNHQPLNHQSLNESSADLPHWRSLRQSSIILLQSVPLMLVLFVIAPRLAPLWSVQVPSAENRTGLSDSMAPGDIGQLTRSAALAFRVQFSGSAPAYNQLYWRALTLDEFDGREWRRGFSPAAQMLGPQTASQQAWFAGIDYLGEPVTYNVILEPTNRNWIYTLQMPRIVDARLRMHTDYQVSSVRRITQRFSYDAVSYVDYRVPESSIRAERRRTISLPEDSNRRAHSFAQQLRQQHGSDADYVQAVLSHFRQQPFFYTLSPAPLGDNPVDEFLFDTRQGFCEHYASAFTFLMRAVGIPARVVTGYMGGEFNPYDGALTVRQYDAHAWSEVWLPGEGWQRMDPTAAVAPDRVEHGSDAVLQEEEAFMGDDTFSLIRFRNLLFLNELRYRLEMVDLAWNRFVLNYDQDTQLALLKRLFGSLSRNLGLLLLFGIGAACTAVMVCWMLRTPARTDKSRASRLYLQFCTLAAKRGYPRAPGEAPRHYLQRLAAEMPQWQRKLARITSLYEDMAYGMQGEEGDRLRELQRLIRQFRLLA